LFVESGSRRLVYLQWIIIYRSRLMFSTLRVVASEDMSLQVPIALKKRKSEGEIRGRDKKKTATHLRDHRHGHGLDGIHPKEHNHAQALEQESGIGHGQDVNSSEDFDHTQVLAELRGCTKEPRKEEALAPESNQKETKALVLLLRQGGRNDPAR
jgi:hypothetical protein